MSPQWTPPSADKQAWAPPAADRQGSVSRDHGDRLKGTPTGLPENFMGTLASDFAGIPAAAAGAFTHPVDTVNSVLHEFFNLPETVVDMIKKGQGGKLAARTLEAVAPGLSSERGAAAIEQAGAVAKGAIKGGMEGAAETIPLNRYGVNVNVPAPVASAAAGAATARMAGLPGTAGAVIGGAAPIVRGMVRGAREAMGPRIAPASFTEPPVMAWDAGAPEGAAVAAPAAAEAVTPGQILARESGADWAKLSPQDQAMLDQVAKARANVAAQPAPTAGVQPTVGARPPVGPEPTVGADPRTAAEMIRDEVAAQQQPTPAPSSPPIGAHKANPPINGGGSNLRPPLRSVAPPEPAQVAPVVDAAPAQPTPPDTSPYAGAAHETRLDRAGWLADDFHTSGVKVAQLGEDGADVGAQYWRGLAAKHGFEWPKTKDAQSVLIRDTIASLKEREAAPGSGVTSSISPESAVPTGPPDLAAIPAEKLKGITFAEFQKLWPPGTPKKVISQAIMEWQAKHK